MSKPILIPVIVVVAAIAAAVLLNPSPEKHRTKIKELVAERSPLAGALGIGSIAAFTSTYHSLGVASYTTVGDRTVSYGAFGIVFMAQ